MNNKKNFKVKPEDIQQLIPEMGGCVTPEYYNC